MSIQKLRAQLILLEVDSEIKGLAPKLILLLVDSTIKGEVDHPGGRLNN
jgi:hypothetical protein